MKPGKYQIFIERYALKQIKNIDKQSIPILKSAIEKLAENPRPFGYKKLRGEEAYRIRVGQYRIIYEIDDHRIIVTVVSVGHRKDIYK
uniref:type II toxin-antitoxin system RelE family toxin n=1 Tax=uncultured Draconibacterium sp. TaxID=1573823 RepID=UPI0032178DB5